MNGEILDLDYYSLPFGDADPELLQKMTEAANEDSDPVSMWWLGRTFDTKECDGAVIIVKGNEATHKLYNILCNKGLLTPDKPISGEAA
jgi:hypothetical protein